MSSTLGSNESSFGSGPGQVSPPAFAGDERGGAVKPSAILGAVGAVSAGASALFPPLAVIGAPLAAIAGIGSAIAGLFGGGLTQQEMDMVMQIKGRVDARRDMRGVVGSPI